MKILKERKSKLKEVQSKLYDCIIIGGGATGTGTALDATLRGLKVLLIEKNDFASGTSSKATKLIHGGVRYLAQFHFKLIYEALSERKKLLQNAPHLVKPLKFVLPTYSIWEKPYYSLGMTLYDVLAGKSLLPKHTRESKESVLKEFPSLKKEGLKGGITYYDASFNDARLNVQVARAAEKEGCDVLTKTEVIGFVHENGKVVGVKAKDAITGVSFVAKAKTIANTTGVWNDHLRKLDDPNAEKMIAPSQGTHLVFSKDTIHCKSAMIIPKTSDGRVVFIIPWEDHVVMGTTDLNVEATDEEPVPLESEVEFLLKTGNEYLETKVSRSDIQSVFAGLRPLIGSSGEGKTKNISREEAILVSPTNLVTMSGGKWSTFRKMGQDLTDKLISVGSLSPLSECKTSNYPIPGKQGYSTDLAVQVSRKYSIHIETARRLSNYYGGEVFAVLGEKPKELVKNSGYFEEEVKWFAEKEFAISILDVLARRFRVLFVDLELSQALVNPVAKVLSKTFVFTDTEKKAFVKEANTLIQRLKKSYQ